MTTDLGGFLSSNGKSTLEFQGLSQAIKDMIEVAKSVPGALESVGLDLGLFLEREVKLGTPVDFGRLRASWGHYTPEDANKGGEIISDKNVSSPDDAYFEQTKDGDTIRVEVGTNVTYGPYVEFGFTVSTERIIPVAMKNGKPVFRKIYPFSYRGAFMMTKALQATEKQIEPSLIQALKDAGFTE